MVLRSIVKIDEEKCTGCGICIPTCAEGALQIVNGKAKLINDKYCDGLGACLGECPLGAITIETRAAEEFDEDAVKQHLTQVGAHLVHTPHQSMLTSWPVQLSLLPTHAPFFENADLLIVADCVPFAYANFHNDFLQDKALIIGCPKLDNVSFYKEKLTKLFTENHIKSITVVNMEVPCCFGLHRLVKEALSSSRKSVPLRQETISLKGDKIPSGR